MRLANFANVSILTGAIVSHGLATLKELQTFYSYEDALDLAEIINVRSYNEWAVTEESRRKQ